MDAFYYWLQVHLFFSILLGLCFSLEFSGAPGQWARFRRWDASTRSDLSFQVKTQASSALLLYLDDGGYCDFLLLAVSDGKLQLRFSVDCAETTVVSDRRVNDSNWHFVTISRSNLRTALRLDSEVKSDEVQPMRQHMKVVSDLFLGVSRRTSMDCADAAHGEGPAALPGVITDLKYGKGEPRLLGSQKVRLDMEGLCAENPCENGGICSVAEGEYLCDCSKTGYIGRFCNEEVNSVPGFSHMMAEQGVVS
ncbi:hypothetical protein COCON_G00094510 [Conger conger]|uniref:Uncharacterized protein n=1 Tax=Conger conger TaxID=82655 RepID=A0A9Q1DLV4_CONCO|nr:hypothetical protein COCON_G00094510 [Conger conger]